MRYAGRVSSLLLAVTACAVAAADEPYRPNDPMFNPGAAHRPGQWTLKNQMPIGPGNAGLDLNVTPAWESGITGQGVTVGLLDFAIRTQHPDLKPNLSIELSRNFNKRGKPDDLYVVESDHGTQSAGIIAAAGGNGTGMTGIAPRAKIVALLTELTFPNPQAIEAIRYGGEVCQIVCQEMGTSAYTDRDEMAALMEASTAKGVVHLRAAGNTRGAYALGDTGTCAVNTTPAAIVISAVGSDGKFASYSNYGAHIFACAFSDASFDDDERARLSLGGPISTSGTESYRTFGGTSAAVPAAAGCVALLRQARPVLEDSPNSAPYDFTRYTKHLLVRTCRVIDADDRSSSSNVDPITLTGGAGWIKNAAGNRFNCNYGFGLIDAGALVAEAGKFSGVSRLVSETATAPAEVKSIPDGSDTGLSYTFEITQSAPMEEALLHIGLAHRIASDVEIILVSPSGTVGRVLSADRDRKHRTAMFARAPDGRPVQYVSNAFWGENPQGKWKLIIRDVVPKDEGTVRSVDLTIRGGQLIPVTQAE